MVLKVRGLIVTIHQSAIMENFFEKTIKSCFGRRVRAERKKRGISQEKLALACELDRSYIGGVERGERNVSLVNIYRIANALNIKAAELFDE